MSQDNAFEEIQQKSEQVVNSHPRTVKKSVTGQNF